MIKIKSNFAILDVLGGTKRLEKHIDKGGTVEVTIRATIDTVHSRHDGTSQEFSMIVHSIDTVVSA